MPILLVLKKSTFDFTGLLNCLSPLFHLFFTLIFIISFFSSASWGYLGLSLFLPLLHVTLCTCAGFHQSLLLSYYSASRLNSWVLSIWYFSQPGHNFTLDLPHLFATKIGSLPVAMARAVVSVHILLQNKSAPSGSKAAVFHNLPHPSRTNVLTALRERMGAVLQIPTSFTTPNQLYKNLLNVKPCGRHWGFKTWFLFSKDLHHFYIQECKRLNWKNIK